MALPLRTVHSCLERTAGSTSARSHPRFTQERRSVYCALRSQKSWGCALAPLSSLVRTTAWRQWLVRGSCTWDVELMSEVPRVVLAFRHRQKPPRALARTLALHSGLVPRQLLSATSEFSVVHLEGLASSWTRRSPARSLAVRVQKR